MTGGAPTQGRSLFGQPVGLTVLFLTEMWEKFSFYGMRALLVYYMTKQLLIAQEEASLIYGFYAAFVYFTPIVGGYVSDRWLGRRKSVIIGGSVMALGHFMMAFEPAFYGALALIAVGNGLFLPSLPSQIGALYGPADPRRHRAYNVYYVGVNLGGLLAPLVCGTLGETLGWHYGFGAAGVGMLAGLVIYVLGRKHLPADPPRGRLVQSGPMTRAGGQKFLLVLLGVGLCVIVFRGAYEQVGNTVALWSDKDVNRIAGGFTIPATWFQALNPLLVFVLTPLFLAHWSHQAAKGHEPSPLAKMSLGAFTVASAFLLLAVVATMSGRAPASWIWLAAFFALLTAGELYILPVGLGLFARLAPGGMVATTIAAWFLAAFAGNLLAGVLGAQWTRMGPTAFFAMMASVAGLSGLLLAVMAAFTRQAEPADDSPVKPAILREG
ncbi:peptide MFS transporter [Caulobacter sp. DWR1-3-2b1]|uniref:peptide MFS transporter n=1 Tax=Caulobacter sp. DWR1-3-2b1 TaxID=2804670 RepID=UPI003CFB9FDA